MKRKPKFIPISAFETIGERTKSSNKRQSKTPKRFEFDLNYLHKTIKNEPKYGLDFEEKVHFGLITGDAINSDSIQKPKRKYCRRKPFRRRESVDNDLDFIVSTSSPKGCGPQLQSQSNHRSVKTIANRYDYRFLSEMPPELVPVDNECDDGFNGHHLIEDSLPAPPLLKPADHLFDPKNGPTNGLNSIDLQMKCKKRAEMALNGWGNGFQNTDPPNHNLDFELLKMKKENDLLAKRVLEVAAEANRLKEENISLKSTVADMADRQRRETSDLKLKHWCTVCLKEAEYYCCWNGSYCTKECQNKHWKSGHRERCCRKLN